MSELKAYRVRGQTLGDTHDIYLKSEADKVIEAKDKEIAELKEQYKDMDVTHTVHIAKMNARIEELENSVDFWKKKNCRLKRALYKVCANWAMAESYSALNDVPTANGWVRTLRKLKAKLEELSEPKKGVTVIELLYTLAVFVPCALIVGAVVWN